MFRGGVGVTSHTPRIYFSVFGKEGKCTCIYNMHEWIVYIMFFLVVCGTSHGSSWLRRNEFLKMTK
jgi:hypothetical protein